MTAAYGYHILTFGCQMNVNDSHWLACALEARGFVRKDLDEADVVLLNTCSVREKPELKVQSTIARIFSLRKHDPRVLVCVLGCVAQQVGEALLAASPQVRLVAGPDGLKDVPALIEPLLTDPDRSISLLDFSVRYEEREKGAPLPQGPTAYVNIMQGCDKFCTYCIVPYTRGRQKSRGLSAILEECREKIALGARELTLLGQNVNAWEGQREDGSKSTFADLLTEVARLPGLVRLRYTSPHPGDMSEEDILAFARLPSLCPSLHLPLQSGSSRILRRMARGYSREDYLNLVTRLKKARPDLALTTDIIVGFPGESEEDLEETLSLMEAVGFHASYSFCYSDRPGARAALFPDKIAPAVQHRRLERLQALQEELGQKWLAGRVGHSCELLIEGRSKRDHLGEISWQGRDPYGALVHVAFNDLCDHTAEMLAVRISSAGKHCLFAEKIV